MGETADVIFQDEETGLWHFWFETFMDHSEGYEDRATCEQMLDKYCKENLQ